MWSDYRCLLISVNAWPGRDTGPGDAFTTLERIEHLLFEYNYIVGTCIIWKLTSMEMMLMGATFAPHFAVMLQKAESAQSVHQSTLRCKPYGKGRENIRDVQFSVGLKLAFKICLDLKEWSEAIQWSMWSVQSALDQRGNYGPSPWSIQAGMMMKTRKHFIKNKTRERIVLSADVSNQFSISFYTSRTRFGRKMK